MRGSLWVLWAGMMLGACGPLPEEVGGADREPVRTVRQALCSGVSADSLTLDGISSFEGELAGSGRFQVSGGANAIHLEYLLDGTSATVEDRTGLTGDWFFSQAAVSCGLHSFELNAYPEIIDSNGNRTVCVSASKTLFQNVLQACPSVAIGLYHTVALKDDGTVWTWGGNASGALGTGTFSHLTPAQVTGLTDVVAITAGAYFSAAVKADGTVWTWGDNSKGQLGDRSTTSRSVPVQAVGLTDVVAVSANQEYILALKKDGTLYGWGRNSMGQLGIGYNQNQVIPVRAFGFGSITSIAAGSSHAVAVKKDGTVWAAGYNYNGQLGDGTTTTTNVPVQVQGLGTPVTAVAAGFFHSMALKKDGTVWVWGDNSYGQLGNGTNLGSSLPVKVSGLSAVRSISAGQFYAAAVRGDGTARAWGDNSYGQLGNGTVTASSVPVPVQSLTDILTVSTGMVNSVAVTRTGNVFAWGYNLYGHLGDGTTTDQYTPVPIALP